MKLSKTMKKILAYICAIAMVVTSMAGYQAAKVSADTDYSTLTYTQVGESDYSVASANDEFPFQLLEDQGTQMLIIPQVAAGTKPIWPDFTNVTLNGETFNQPAGAGIYIPYSSLNQEYNVFEATSAVDNHTFQIIIKKATTSGGGDDPAPTPSTLKWSELYTVNDDAEKVDTSTEEAWGATFTGFKTDWSWSGDSKWQGQAKALDLAVTAGEAYTVSFDVTSTPAKQILVQTLSGTQYTEKTFNSEDGHIEMTFAANTATVNVVIAFGAMNDAEVGTYDVAISNMKLVAGAKTPEMIEKERVEKLLVSETNIAKGKTAFASTETYPAKEAFDGNLASRWAANSPEGSKDGEYVGVDLGKLYSITSVALAWEGAYASEYDIQVSTDGENYDTVKTVTATKNETIEIKLDEAVDAQFVRIFCTKAGTEWNCSIWEAGVYGTEKGGDDPQPTDPQPTEPVDPTAIAVTAGEPKNNDNGTVSSILTWEAVEGAVTYKIFVDNEETVATAPDGFAFDKEDRLDTVNDVKLLEGTHTYIVVAYGAEGEIARGTVQLTNGDEPQPTDPQPTDPQPTDPQPTDPQPTEPVDPTVIAVTAGEPKNNDNGTVSSILTWEAVEGAVTYKIFVDNEETVATAPDGFAFDKEDRLDTVNDVKLLEGTHTYIVVAYGAEGEIARGTVQLTNGDEPQPTDPQPTDPQPTDPQPTDPQPTEPVTGPAYNPGFDPSTLDYQDMTCEGGETIGYALQSSTIDGVVPFYENSGNTFSVMFSGDAGIVSDVTVNGQEPAEGVIIEKATGVVRVNPTKFADNAYTVVKVVAEKGELTFVVKKGTPAPIDPQPTDPQPTDPQPTDPQPTEPPTKDPEAVKARILSDDNIAKGCTAFASSYNPDWGEGNIQEAVDGNLNSRWAAASTNPGEYIGVDLGAVKTITGVALVWEGAYASQYDIQVSTDGEEYTTVKSVTATTNETVEFDIDEVEAQYVRILCNEAGTGWNYSIFELAVYEKQVGPVITFDQIQGDGTEKTLEASNWKMWIADSHLMAVAVDPEDGDHIKSKIVSNNNNWDAWSVQYIISKYGLKPGEKYSVSFDVSSTSTDFRLTLDGNTFFNGNQDMNEVTVEAVDVEADNTGAVKVTAGAGLVGIGVTIDISNIVVKDKDGNVVQVSDIPVDPQPTDPQPTDPQPTDPQPTDPQPTDPQPTDSQPTNPTTVAPTTATPTTVAPTTTASTDKVKAPGKAKIKKVNAKKITAKKVKLTLKKVSKAKGYQVAVYKTKKNAKKNKKAIVKKFVKKTKATISNKKLKNKKTLYVKARAYVLDGKKKVYGKWSAVKKVKVK